MTSGVNTGKEMQTNSGQEEKKNACLVHIYKLWSIQNKTSSKICCKMSADKSLTLETEMKRKIEV